MTRQMVRGEVSAYPHDASIEAVQIWTKANIESRDEDTGRIWQHAESLIWHDPINPISSQEWVHPDAEPWWVRAT